MAGYIAIIISAFLLVVQLTNYRLSRRIHTTDVPKVETEWISNTEFGADTEALRLLIRNSGRRNVEGLGIRFKKGNLARFIPILVADGHGNPTKLMLSAGGAELMVIYPSSWALQLNHSRFLSLHDAESTLVTGIADLPFDLPKKIKDAVNIELEVLQSVDIARYTQAHQQKQVLEVAQAAAQFGFMRNLFTMQNNIMNPPEQHT